MVDLCVREKVHSKMRIVFSEFKLGGQCWPVLIHSSLKRKPAEGLSRPVEFACRVQLPISKQRCVWTCDRPHPQSRRNGLRSRGLPQIKRARYKLERVMGIEPTLFAWEAKVLPLNYTRVRLDYRSSRQGWPNPVFRKSGSGRQPSQFLELNRPFALFHKTYIAMKKIA